MIMYRDAVDEYLEGTHCEMAIPDASEHISARNGVN